MAKEQENLKIATALLEVAEQIRRQFDHSLGTLMGITLSEYELLRALAAEHKQTATRVVLAAAVKKTPSGITRALRPLEKLHYVKTTKDARDARRSLAALTPQGEELVANAHSLIEDIANGIEPLSALAAEEGTPILQLLNGLRGQPMSQQR